ncbi:MAG: hypothetical protein ACM4D3_10290 [Candidatus Sericytochromatia bacterium]
MLHPGPKPWLGGLGLVNAPINTGVLGHMQPTTQELLGACLLIGRSLALVGSCLGPGGIWPVRRLAWHFEVRNAYLIPAGGMFAIEAALTPVRLSTGVSILTTRLGI